MCGVNKIEYLYILSETPRCITTHSDTQRNDFQPSDRT